MVTERTLESVRREQKADERAWTAAAVTFPFKVLLCVFFHHARSNSYIMLILFVTYCMRSPSDVYWMLKIFLMIVQYVILIYA